MEWSKTKTYLIIALIVTNLILLLSIYSNRNESSNNFDKKNLKNLEKLLSDKNIKYDIKLNTDTKKLSPIELNFATLDDEVFKNLNKNYSNELKIIEDLFVELSIPVKQSAGYDKILEFSKKFIRENFDENNYALKLHYNEENIIVLEYEELYENMFLEQGYIRFIYNKNNIYISIVKTNDIRKAEKAIETISNAEAISKMLPRIGENSTIKNIDMGYYRPENWQEVGTSQIRLIPFWRIELDDGKFLYTEAIKN